MMQCSISRFAIVLWETFTLVHIKKDLEQFLRLVKRCGPNGDSECKRGHKWPN